MCPLDARSRSIRRKRCASTDVSRLIQSEYHGIHGIDVVAFGGSAALFLTAMLLASAVPALRASRLDPVESLKDA
jgi:hypothetical protein